MDRFLISALFEKMSWVKGENLPTSAKIFVLTDFLCFIFLFSFNKIQFFVLNQDILMVKPTIFHFEKSLLGEIQFVSQGGLQGLK